MKDRYDDLIKSAANLYLPTTDWRLYKAQLWQESRLNPDAVSPAGAAGVAQFMAPTWKEWSAKAGFPEADRFHPEPSIFTGAMYMQHLIKSWSRGRPEMDRHCLAMASYNAGLGSILKAQKAAGDPAGYAEIISGLESVTKHHSKETIQYVQKILGFYVVQITG